MRKFLSSCLIVGFLLPLGPVAPGATFTNVTEDAGLSYIQSAFVNEGPDVQQPYMSGGAAAGDYDGDGWIDLYATRQGQSDLLYRNRGDGTFENVTDQVFGPDHLAGIDTNGVAWADIDNDGDLDLYVTTMEHPQHLLYINDGQGGFTEEAIARGADVPDVNGHPRFGFSATFGDYDDDGYLDLHTTEWRLSAQSGNDQFARHNTRLLRNRGASQPGFFDDVTDAAGVATELIPSSAEELTNSEGFASRFSDIDRDGHLDLLLVQDHNTSRLFWNNGDGTFTDGTVAANVGTDHNGMGNAIGDIDNDGDMDWFVTSIFQDGATSEENPLLDRDGNRLYRYDGNRSFTDITDAAGVRDGAWGWGAAFLDYDNDGDLDLAMTNGMDHPFGSFDLGFERDVSVFWENDGSGNFTRASEAVGFNHTGSGKGLLTFDYDQDGDLDIFVTNNSAGLAPRGAVLFRNDGGNEANWLRIDLTGTSINSQAVGAFVTVTKDLSRPDEIMVREAHLGSHFLGQGETTLHFGLGASTIAEHVKVEWPDGSVSEFSNVAANTNMEVTQNESLTGYAAWATLNFDGEGEGVPEISGLFADPDSDDLPNLEEYAIGTNPKVANTESPLSLSLFESDGKLYPQITYPSNSNALDVGTFIEESVELVNWSDPAELFDFVEIVDSGDGISLITARRPTPLSENESLFLRVKIVLFP